MHATYDAVIVGGGHNGLTAAAYLARAGRTVLLLERADHVGGATLSARAFPGVDANVSRYSYLVSLLPRQVRDELGLRVELRRRRISSYTPAGDRGLLVDTADAAATAASFADLGAGSDVGAWRAFGARTGALAARLFPTMTEPLLSAADARRLLDEDDWRDLVERPIGELVDATFSSDLVRGVVLTDALIGTFARAHETGGRPNRCFLYHVIGGGTGDWDVPVGGMGAVAGALEAAARGAGAELVTSAEVVAVDPGTTGDAEVVWTDAGGGEHRVGARHVLAACAPAVLDLLLGRAPDEAPEGAQLKVNMLLTRLPRLRSGIDPRTAFAGTFHVHESATELEIAYQQAAASRIPDVPPVETYCHSLTDDSILGPGLRATGHQTLTAFGLHMPARLFVADPEGSRAAALAATLRSIDSVLAEPLEDCLARDVDGRPCLEVRSPVDLEADVRLPGGHIFHRDLAWPWAERDDEVGTWGVETADRRVLLAGAGARRGGGVSGIPGRAAAMAVLGRA
ncbi:phytoene desaturase family protein [Cellulomonas sp.]|uniref:phytoene desaturase family protein n=1 Tax=Cellulomonas sp. TaxID=40001 RepID=UPI003BADB765